MSDVIPDDMQAAIDAYDGPVTICPPRTFAIDASTPIPIDAAIKAHWDRKRAAARAMQNQIARMFNEGGSPSKIARAVGLADNTVQKHLKRLREAGAVGLYERPKGPQPFAPGSTAERVLKLANGKRTIADIAASCDLNRKSVDCALRRLRRAGYRVPIRYEAGHCRNAESPANR